MSRKLSKRMSKVIGYEWQFAEEKFEKAEKLMKEAELYLKAAKKWRRRLGRTITGIRSDIE